LIFEQMMYSSQQGKAVLKHRVCYLAPALAAVLVQLSFSAHAFTLGNLRGAAVLGRPLDVTVQVQAGSDEVLSSSCVSADVFYADAHQSAVKVTVLPVAGVPTGSVVRVQSPVAIDEPVVTVEVRANCGSSTLRRYVLLADLPAPAAAVPLSVPAAIEALPVLVLPTPAPSGQSEAVAPAKPLRSGAVKPATAKIEPRQASVKPRKTQAVVAAAEQALAQKAAARASGKSVLKLDPMDLLSDRIDALDSAMLFAPTEDALRYSRQISSLEGDVKTLRALAASNDAKLSDLTAKLQQAQASQIPLWVIYGLVALVLACLAIVMWLLKQQQRTPKDATPSWWHGSEDGALTELLPQTAASAPSPVQHAKPAAPAVEEPVFPAKAPAVPMAGVNIDLDLDQVTQPISQLGSFDVNTSGAPFELNSIRHISVEPILDIRQQAEFFVSLGQTERAVQILKKQIAESTEPNPLVYLDLITLYHALGIKAEFRECREMFHLLFNGVIPDFPAFNLEGHDLESYPEVLAMLTPLWPRIDALALLSTCIFHDANGQAKTTYDLAAFRDLLLLHALAESLVADQPEPVLATLPERATPVIMATPAQELVNKPVEESVSRMLDLDFSDLGDLPESSGKE